MSGRCVSAQSLAIGQAGTSMRRESSANKIGGTHVVWASLLTAHAWNLNHLPGRIPGSIRFTLLEPNFVGKDSGHHKGPPPGER